MRDTPLIRRRFVSQLEQVAASHALTMLIGPAGSGKTVALQQLSAAIEGQGIRVAAYDPPSDRKAAAARDFASWLHRSTDDRLAAQSAGDQDASSPRLVIVIDAYDRVDTSEMAAAIRTAIARDHGIRIVVAMRRKQKLNVSDLIANEEAAVIDTAVLFFTVEEIAEMLGDAPPHRYARKVRHYARGWPIAVRRIRDRQADGTAPPATDGLVTLDAHLAEYIDEQIVDGLSLELQKLLFCIAPLESIRPMLVDHVRGRSDSARSLAGLSRELPGLVWREDAGEAETYKIARPLRDRLLESDELPLEERTRIVRRAVAWYCEKLLFEHAIAQARSANDVDLLETALDDLYIWRIFLDRGLSGLLLILKSLLPSEIAARPRLRLMACLASFRSGLYTEAQEIFEELRRETSNFGHDPYGNGPALRRDASLIEIGIAATFQGVQTEDRLFERASRAADRNDRFALATIEISRCAISEMRGELPKAMDAWRRSEAIVRGTMDAHFTEAWLPYHLPFIDLARGAYREAMERFAVIERKDAMPDENVPSEALASIVKSAIAYERRFVEEAGGQLRDALDLLGTGSNWFVPCAIAYSIMFEVAHRSGGGAAIPVLASTLRGEVSGAAIPDVADMLDALEAAWLLRAGIGEEVKPLIEQIERSHARPGCLPWRLFDAQLTALFHWSLRQGDLEGALDRTAQLIEAGRAGGRLRTMAKGRLFRAVVLDRSGRSDEASRELASVLGMTAHEQMIAPFAEEGRLASALIAQVASDPSASAVARRQAAIVMRVMPLAVGEITALNERETEIATCISQGESNKMIARKIGVSEDTVKFHVKKIFAKLGVTGRKAVAQAMQDRAIRH